MIARSLSPRAQWARYNFNDYPAIVINVIALALIFWVAITLARRSKSAWAMEVARASFLFALIVVINGLIQTMTKFEDQTSAPVPQASGGDNRRIVWLVFDEADQRLAFGERAATLKLPEFDRLRSQSLFATIAYPPANQTLSSMPALINGKLYPRRIRSIPLS